MNAFDNSILERDAIGFGRADFLRKTSLAFGLIIIVLLCSPLASSVQGGEVAAEPKVAFGRSCETLLVREIGGAEKEITVAIFSLTRRNITSALARAIERGVKVRIKYDEPSMDSSEDNGMQKSIAYLKNSGAQCTPIKMSDERARMHHKFMVIDGKRVLTGSYNYTSTATTANYENLLLVESAEIAKQFLEEFERIKDR